MGLDLRVGKSESTLRWINALLVMVFYSVDSESSCHCEDMGIIHYMAKSMWTINIYIYMDSITTTYVIAEHLIPKP